MDYHDENVNGHDGVDSKNANRGNGGNGTGDGSLVTAALEFARQGIPVFPIGSNSRPLTPNGFYDATVNEARVAEMFADPGAVYVSGRMGGHFAGLDIDNKDSRNGFETLCKLEAKHGELPPSFRLSTPRHGEHRVFTKRPKLKFPTTQDKLGPGIEIKGEDSSIILYGPDYVLQSDDPYAPWPAAWTEAIQDKPKPPNGEDSSWSDADLVARIEASKQGQKFKELMQIIPGLKGNDDSQLDASLCGLIACWTLNAEQIERLWATSTLATREKWQRNDYRQRTIEFVIERERADRAKKAEDASAQPEPEPTEEPASSAKAKAPPTILPINLPEEFWNARPVFKQIRNYAWRHRTSGDGALYGCLVRTTALVPPGTVMFSKEKPSVLNLFLALLGMPGEGKSVLDDVIRDILPVPDWSLTGYRVVESNGIGTGEGLVALLCNVWDKKQGWLQDVFNLFVYIDEGSILNDLKQRTGATISKVLLVAFTGKQLETPNAVKQAVRRAKDYCLAVIMCLQDEAAKLLLQEDKYGAPQRYLFSRGTDPQLPVLDKPKDAPRPVLSLPTKPEAINFEQRIFDEIDLEIAYKAAGQLAQASAMDAHILWIRCKVAAVLAIWDGRNLVNEEDWRLAKILVDVSCANRDALLASIEEDKKSQARAKLEQRITDSITLKSTDNRILSLAHRIAAKLQKETRLGEGRLRADTMSAKERKDPGSRNMFEAALHHAEAQRWIERDGDSAWKAGPKTAS